MSKRNLKTEIILTIVFTVLCIAIIFPLLLVLSVSFSEEMDIIRYGYKLIPNNLSLNAYKFVLKNPQAILDAYGVTISFSLITMVLSVIFMSMIAYALSKRNIRGKSAISFYLYFTMLFSGGLAPSYILITQYLHLNDTIWVYILPSLISPWYVFLMRTFFQGLPYEISESALMDGANEYTIFFRIILPLSKPVLASVALFVFLAQWNNWYTAMLYINNQRLISLQYLLQRIMTNIQMLRNTDMSTIDIALADIPGETARMAMAMLVAGPALIVFPFFQKYFVKGLTVGSVKG